MIWSPLLLLALGASAAPSPAPSKPLAVPLVKRQPSKRQHDSEWAKSIGESLRNKYGGGSHKRATGTNALVNRQTDSMYYGSVAVGTPPVAFNVILDTGSADLWLASSTCWAGCDDNIPSFDSSRSSTFRNMTTPFTIRYGSGAAAGELGSDSVRMAGFQVNNQTFALADQVSRGLLSNPISGLMGLGWSTIATSRATPMWETLARGNQWSEPVMSFFLTRFLNVNGANILEPGGEFMMGGTNPDLYTGDIDYVNIPDGQESYWIIPMTGLGVNGVNVLNGNSYAAIDTATTLVGGPSDSIAAIFAQIPGSQPGTGNWEGYYLYPCSTSVTITMTFSSRTWTINPDDFILNRASGTQCIGAFFTLNLSGSAPSWIVGDTFLKNVYSVYRYNPPSVGFANLSSSALAQNSLGGDLPSATIGSSPITATGTASNGAVGAANGAVSVAAALGAGVLGAILL